MQFDEPSPQNRSGHDFSTNPLRDALEINYKAGKMDSASVKMFFAGKMDQEFLSQGFWYYDREAKQKVPLPKFTAYVIGVYFGSFSNGKEKGDINYTSNLVVDTRHDVIQSSYFINRERHTFAIGNYSLDIAPRFKELGRGSSYQKVLVAYVPELKQVCKFFLNATAEAGLVKTIARARRVEEWKSSLYGLSDLETEVWVFEFGGEFEPVVFTPNDAKRMPATVPATKDSPAMYFQPIFNGGVLRADNAAQAEKVTFVQSQWREVVDYLASEQDYFKGVIGEVSKPATAQDEADAQAAREAEFAKPTTRQLAEAEEFGTPAQQRASRNYDPFPGNDITSYDETGTTPFGQTTPEGVVVGNDEPW